MAIPNSSHVRPRWIDPPVVPDELPPLHPDPLLHALLAARVCSVRQAEDFLDTSPRRIPDPMLVPGMTEAVDRLARAIDGGERIGVFGDYDADGLTSTAIVAIALDHATGQTERISTELPNRATGYGLNRDAIDRFAAMGVTMLVAVDCGTNERENVVHAYQSGIDLIAVDHHELNGDPAEQMILVSPRLLPDAPYRDMPAASLALLVATALARRGYDVGDGAGVDPASLIDLAMIGTIADVSDVRGENRAIVRDGLRLLRERPRAGLLALLRALKIDPETANARTVSHRVAPALNAPGRRGDPAPALALLLASNLAEADRLVRDLLESLQWVRTERERLRVVAHGEIAANPRLGERRIAILTLDDCPAGLAGVVAGGLSEDLGRPAIVLGRDGERYRGSARSRGDFDIGLAIQSVAHLLERAGGHKKAAGLSLLASQLEAFRDEIERVAMLHGVDSDATPSVQIDADLPLNRLDLATWMLLGTLRPHGEGNPEPVFRIRALPLHDYSTMGNAGQHLKLRVKSASGFTPVILWGAGERSRELVGVRSVDVIGAIDRNEWNGRISVQFVARDFRIANEV